jgi:hypothetical protein
LGWSKDKSQPEVANYRKYVERFNLEDLNTVGCATCN